MSRGARSRFRLAGFLLSLTTAITACAPQGSSTPHVSPSASGLVAQIASFQLVANRPGRLLVALVTGDNRWLSFGTIRFAFTYIGPAASSATGSGPGSTSNGSGASLPDAMAGFLPIPGSPQHPGAKPALTAPADGHGLYVAEPITFPAAGYWRVVASGAQADGTIFHADAAFEVLRTPIVIDVGQPALKTDNPVLGTPDIAKAAIDSRAVLDGTIPDPELHRVSIAEAIAAHHPALVVFSTPVYCVSQFCGPVTDMVDELAKHYADRADFIHVEIYRDFDKNALNQAAMDWLRTPSGDLREPWAFLIGADGRISASWDTVVTRGEVEPLLQALPPLKR